MREVAIIGVGMHPWGKFTEKDYVDIGVEAIRNTLEDAGIDWTDIQEVAASSVPLKGGHGLVLGQTMAARLGENGVPITNIWGMCATATSVFKSAYNSVASGQCDIALSVGLDVTPKGFLPNLSKDHPEQTEYLRQTMIGLTNPSYWALECRKRMAEYGTTELHLAKAKVVCSKHGALNPFARYQKVFTVEDVLNSPMVCDPLRLYEICATSDGAAAAVLCSMDEARKHTTKPVTIAAVTLGSSLYGDPTNRLGLICSPVKAEAPMVSESYSASHQAYEKAGIGPEDLDLVELPDNSSWHYLQYIETLGLCGSGEAERLLDEGATEIGGRIPVCPSGGLASFGEAPAAHGLVQIYEIVQQLRGQAGARQVQGAKVGMAQTYGIMGNSGSAILKI